MKNIKLTIEYDGTDFCGWQKQNGLRTVEGVLNAKLSKALNEDIAVIGSGRTDARVHALGQVANFKTGTMVPPEKLPRVVNAYLPPDMAILSAEEAPWDFHARYAPKRKTYLYKVCNRKNVGPLLRNQVLYYPKFLDEKRMREALDVFMGEHDFSAFMSAGSRVKNTVRTLYRGDISREKDLYLIEVEGNGFLYNMMRRIVGVLLEAGNGNLETREIVEILNGKDNEKTRCLAEPQGLYLKSVKYEG